MKKFVLLLLVAILAGCASSVVKIEGDHLVQQRLNVKVSDAWNKFPSGGQPFELWTQEGLTLDQLRIWAGIKSGQSLVMASTASSDQKAQRVPTYTAGMAPDQLVNLLEIMYSADGSLVSMDKVEPAPFAGEKGLRIEFSITRKSDDVQLRGVGWMAVRNNELFAASFVAPRLAFFPRLLPRAERVMQSARIAG